MADINLIDYFNSKIIVDACAAFMKKENELSCRTNNMVEIKIGNDFIFISKEQAHNLYDALEDVFEHGITDKIIECNKYKGE